MSYLGTSGPAQGVHERRLHEHRGMNDRMMMGTGACTEGHHHTDIKTEAPIHRTRREHRALYNNTNNTHTRASDGCEKQFRNRY